MNKQAEKHLQRAEGLFARGDGFYHKAVEEIVAAQKADSTLSNREIGSRFGKTDSWVRSLVQWHTSADGRATPFAGDTPQNRANELAKTKRVLREAPLEQVEHIVGALPAKQAAKLAQAALERPGVARELAKTSEGSASVHRASGRVSEEMQSQNRQRTRAARGTDSPVDGLEVLVEVLGGIRGAKRKLYDSYTAARDHRLNKSQREAAHEILDELATIIDWYRGYLDSGDQSFEDELAKLLTD